MADPREQQAFGVDRRERAPWFDEALPLLRRLWQEDEVEHHGERFALDGITGAVAAGDGLALLGVWRNPARLLIVRGGKPLCFGQTPHGLYFASLPQGLPGRVYSVAEGSASVLTYAAGRVRQQTAFLRTRDS